MTRNRDRLIPIAVFALAFWLVPLRLFDGLTLMPGDVADARLNNYFLETIYQFLSGRVPSLWHLTFYDPFPWVLGFSDNLFGTAPVYLLARVAGASSDTAFQIWFLSGYAANFAAAYYALRRLGGSAAAASVGALIFAFALPTTPHSYHAQLHHRFAVPLALLFFAAFLERGRWSALLASLGWLVWQFYAGIYIGFFTAVLMALMVLVHLALAIRSRWGRGRPSWRAALAADWRAMPHKQKIGGMVAAAVLLGLLVVLFYPYVRLSALYGTTRHWNDISTMLPRPQSYLLADRSWLWAPPVHPAFDSLPMRHEHQMFAGLVPLLLALAGIVVALRKGLTHGIALLTGAMVLMVMITLYVGGLSLWYLVHRLPLASAIRAMTRFDQVLLFPLGVLAMIAIDGLRHRFGAARAAPVLGIVIALGIAEMAAVTAPTSEKTEWRARIAAAEAALPADIPADAVLFMAQTRPPFPADEVDAMWVALRLGIPTMNGYSGSIPPWLTWRFGTDCDELGRRIVAYQTLFPPADPEADYLHRAARVLAVGFPACDPAVFARRPAITASQATYSPDDVRHLSYRIAGIDPEAGEVRVTITNSADFSFSAWSAIDRPLRLSWRFRDRDAQPMSWWEYRRDLPHDIPAGAAIEVTLPLEIPEGAVTIEVSMVQELRFWFFEVGIEPATAPLPEVR